MAVAGETNNEIEWLEIVTWYEMFGFFAALKALFSCISLPVDRQWQMPTRAKFEYPDYATRNLVCH